MEDLEAMLEKDITTTDTLYTKADVEVTVTKEKPVEVETTDEKPELTKEEFAAKCKKEAMEKLGEFEELENQKVVVKN